MIKPIETVYKGYRFRSRLEARWAVFFDSLNIPYEYEKEGFQITSDIYYLPDFYLPHLDLWIEIIPGYPQEWPEHPVFWLHDIMRENEKPRNEWPLQNFIVLKGTPFYAEDTYSGYYWPYMGYISGDNCYLWWECPVCGKIGIEFDGRAARLCRNCCPDSDKSYNANSPKLIAAYMAARQARFEHGEKG